MTLANISVDYINHCGDDLSVVNAARVSFDKESFDLNVQDEKLIKYLAKHKHFSPFNHAFISVRVKAPLVVARQLGKHKFMPWNEVSRRYVQDDPEFYFPEYWRKKADNVKQGSSEKRCEAMYENADKDWLNEDISMPLDDQVNLLALNQKLLYREMIEKGCSAEQARMILPQNMMTTWIWSGTLGAFCDMLKLRLDSHTQYETRIVATKVREIIEPIFPVSVKALLEIQ